MSVGLNTRFLFVNKETKEFNLTRTDAWWENKQTDSEQKKIFELETKNKSPDAPKAAVLNRVERSCEHSRALLDCPVAHAHNLP